MSRTFSGTLPLPADELMEKLQELCDQYSIDFQGDECRGEAQGKGFHLSYEIEGEDYTINVLKKPMVVPWSLLESQMKTALDLKD